MQIPAWTTTDFVSAFLRLLPRGRAWRKMPNTGDVTSDAIMPGALSTLMSTYARLAARDAYLLVDSFPAATDELLPEWQATLGLPDPCAGLSATLQQSQQQVVARLAAGGGQSVPYFINFAANLGYDITITEFSPFRASTNAVGQPLYSQDWFFAWQVNAPTITETYFRADLSAVGEPLDTVNNTVLDCELSRLRPAHTTILFNFGAA